MNIIRAAIADLTEMLEILEEADVSHVEELMFWREFEGDMSHESSCQGGSFRFIPDESGEDPMRDLDGDVLMYTGCSCGLRRWKPGSDLRGRDKEAWNNAPTPEAMQEIEERAYSRRE